MSLPNRILKERLDYISESNDVTKADLMDILYIALEEGISIQDAIADFYIEEIDDMFENDLERKLDYIADQRYDEYKDSRFE